MPARRHHEIEVKLRVADIAVLRRKLRALGARLLNRVQEWNVLLDTPRQRLRKNGQLLRLRSERPLSSPKAPVRSLLTYKGPGLQPRGSASLAGFPGDSRGSCHRYKVRVEVEAPVSEPERLAGVLASIGLVPSFRYEKYRSTYRLPRLSRLLIELDETPIGVFLELEGSPRSIDRASRLLGFTPDDYLVSSYAALYFDYCRRHRLPPGDMLFAM